MSPLLMTPLPLPRRLARTLHYGETPIDTFDEWVLVLRPEPDGGRRNPWVSYRVARPKPETGRRSFWLASNGERMAEGHDMVALRHRHPDIAAWVEPIAVSHARMINDTAAVAAVETKQSAEADSYWSTP